MRVVAISDTHGLHDYVKVPDGDLLIHAGDCTGHGTLQEIVKFNKWLGTLPHKNKIIIAGNHDFDFQIKPELAEAAITNAIYLRDKQTIIEGQFSVYGSPWQPEFHNWAFNVPRGPSIRKIWEKIPDDVDILVTHGPPHKVLDKNWRRGYMGSWDKENGEHCGCEELAIRIWNVQPQAHIFGHIHEGYGVRDMQGIGTKFINASVCTRDMEPTNQPIVFDL